MRISLVIPTRERVELLRHCLAGALACPDPDLEIVVSDNVSTDGTDTLLSGIDDPRLKVVRPGTRVSMRLNFETGLDAATGDYVIFIGDDDGVSPAGMAMLRHLLERMEPEAVNWELISYAWPSAQPGQTCGLLPVKFKSVLGGCAPRPAADLLGALCAGRLRNYKETANIYHGCISRRVIERVRKANGGSYFAGAFPDVYTGIANLVHMRGDLLWLGHPVTFGGSSDRSNGAAQMTAVKGGSAGEQEKSRFAAETGTDPGTAEIHVNVPSVNALTLDMLRLVNRHHARNALHIDHAQWFHRILRRLAPMPLPSWEAGIGMLRTYAGRIDQAGCFDRVRARHRHTGPKTVLDNLRPHCSRFGLKRMLLAHPRGLATVADAAKAIDTIFGPEFDQLSPSGALLRPVRWLRSLSRARALVRQWDRSD